jgi:hypothetical protein
LVVVVVVAGMGLFLGFPPTTGVDWPFDLFLV